MLPTTRVLVIPSATGAAGEHVAPAITLDQALDGPWDELGWDAHITQYGRADGGPCSRLLKCQLAEAEADGVELHVAFIDLDTPGHVAWADGPRGDQAIDALEDCLGRAQDAGYPVGGYTSRAGLRLVLPLVPAVPLSKATGTLEAVYAALKRAVGDVGPLGLEWDEAANAQWFRLFRAPRALRDGEPLRPYSVLPTGSYNARPLAEAAEAEVPSAPTAGPAGAYRVEVPVDAWYYVVRPNTKAGEVRLELAEGLPLPYPEGGRNQSLLALVRSLSKQLAPQWPNATDLASVLYSICAPSVAADTRPGSPTLDELRGMCSRTSPLDATGERMTSADTEHELAPPTHGEGVLVVAHRSGQSYFIRSCGTWVGPFSPSIVCAAFAMLHPGIDCTSQGGAPWSGPRLLQAYGRVVAEVSYRQAPRPFRDGDDVLEVPLYDRVDTIEPRYDADVAHWLKLLCPGPALVNWLSWLDDLTEPLPALVLFGPAGTGKSMLASAIAGYWGGQAADFKRVLAGDGFALSTLGSSPVILGDDVSGGFRSERETGAFRELVANTQHSVNVKYQSVATYHTATRVIITSNDPGVMGIRGRHSNHDTAAIGARILGLSVSRDPADWLEASGGRKFTKDWLPPGGRPGRLLQHIAWLQSQRSSHSGGRFAVLAQVSSEISEGAMLSTDEDTTIWLAVARALECGNTDVARVHEPGVVYVSGGALYSAWPSLGMDLSERVTMAAIARALRQASESASSVTIPRNDYTATLRYWSIPSSLVLRAARDVGAGNHALLMKLHTQGNVAKLETQDGETGAAGEELAHHEGGS